MIHITFGSIRACRSFSRYFPEAQSRANARSTAMMLPFSADKSRLMRGPISLHYIYSMNSLQIMRENNTRQGVLPLPLIFRPRNYAFFERFDKAFTAYSMPNIAPFFAVLAISISRLDY